MNEFSINIINDTFDTAILSGKHDDPYQWISAGNSFYNTNIHDVKLGMIYNGSDIAYEYSINNIDNLSICILLNNDNTSGVVSIAEFIENIYKYDDITIEYNNSASIHALMSICGKNIRFIIRKLIGYRRFKYTLKIIL
jgi:hypothetical protein